MHSAEERRRKRENGHTNQPNATFHERADVEVIGLRGAVSTIMYALPSHFEITGLRGAWLEVLLTKPT